VSRSLAWLGLSAALVSASASAGPTLQFCIGKNCPKQPSGIGIQGSWPQPTRNGWPVAPPSPPPQIEAIGDAGFATASEIETSVGSRRYEFECPSERDVSNLDNSTVFQRGARVYLGKPDADYSSSRIQSGLLRDAISVTWDKCPMSSTPQFGGSVRTRYELGFVDVFAGAPAPKLVLHAERYNVLGGAGHWSKLTNVAAQEAREQAASLAQEQKVREAADRAAAEQRQQAATQAAQRAATAERARLQAERQAYVQRIEDARAEASSRWWGGFGLLVVLGAIGWLIVKFNEPLLRWFFLLIPTPVKFDFDAALAQNTHLSGSALFVKFRMHAQKIKLDAWKERNAADREALAEAARRDAERDHIYEERARAQVHRTADNVNKMREAEQSVVDDKIEGIKRQPTLNKKVRRREEADHEKAARQAERESDEIKEGTSERAAAKKTFDQRSTRINELYAERNAALHKGNYSPEALEKLLQQSDLIRERDMQELMNQQRAD